MDRGGGRGGAGAGGPRRGALRGQVDRGGGEALGAPRQAGARAVAEPPGPGAVQGTVAGARGPAPRVAAGRHGQQVERDRAGLRGAVGELGEEPLELQAAQVARRGAEAADGVGARHSGARALEAARSRRFGLELGRLGAGLGRGGGVRYQDRLRQGPQGGPRPAHRHGARGPPPATAAARRFRERHGGWLPQAVDAGPVARVGSQGRGQPRARRQPQGARHKRLESPPDNNKKNHKGRGPPRREPRRRFGLRGRQRREASGRHPTRHPFLPSCLRHGAPMYAPNFFREAPRNDIDFFHDRGNR
mmetsp:Transcript_404/g.903  ORF Transcript_404/g.903 Transcript_404/m.903 type:complete len:304 (+) Transcript_404:523-1434(+)